MNKFDKRLSEKKGFAIKPNDHIRFDEEQLVEAQQALSWESEKERIAEYNDQEDISIDQLMQEYVQEDNYQQYLVDGAILRCTNTTLSDFPMSDETVKLTQDVDETIGDRERTRLSVRENPMFDNNLRYATVKNTTMYQNISPFNCNCMQTFLSQKEKESILADASCNQHGVCRHLMELNAEWDNMPVDGTSYLKRSWGGANFDIGGVAYIFGSGFSLADEEAEGITMTSVLYCKHGGVIYPETSGQIIQIIKEPTVSAKACATYNGPKGGLTEEQIFNNAQYIYNYLEKQGWTMEAICGLLGNIYMECTMNPGIWRDWENTSRPYGLVQWKEPSTFFDYSDLSADEVNNMANTNPQELMDLQLNFLITTMLLEKDEEGLARRWLIPNAQKYYDIVEKFKKELNEDFNKDCRTMTGEEFIQSSFDVADLAAVFCASYERSECTEAGIRERIDYAELWYSYFSGENPDISLSDFEMVRMYWRG